MENYNPATQSAECTANLKIAIEDTGIESKPLRLTYKIFPSSEKTTQYVVSVDQAEQLKNTAGSLLQFSLLQSMLDQPEPQDDIVPENSLDAASYNSADAATAQEEADLDQNASDAAAIDVNR